MSWDAELIKPIPLPKSRKIIRPLSDARAYILTLPKKRQHDEDVQAACEALLLAAKHPAAILHANIGIGRVVLGPIDLVGISASKRRRS